MAQWTFLVIALAAPYEDYATALPYRTLDECWAAAPLVVDTLSVPVDMIQCVETGTLSSTIRPRPRPADLCEKNNSCGRVVE